MNLNIKYDPLHYMCNHCGTLFKNYCTIFLAYDKAFCCDSHRYLYSYNNNIKNQNTNFKKIRVPEKKDLLDEFNSMYIDNYNYNYNNTSNSNCNIT